MRSDRRRPATFGPEPDRRALLSALRTLLIPISQYPPEILLEPPRERFNHFIRAPFLQHIRELKVLLRRRWLRFRFPFASLRVHCVLPLFA